MIVAVGSEEKKSVIEMRWENQDKILKTNLSFAPLEVCLILTLILSAGLE